MSRLDQIQISFVAAEDRLMMRMSTNEDSEFRFWLTRRFVKALRPALEGTLGKQTRIQTQVTQSARKELLAFEHEKAVQSADFATPYKPHDKSLPLGEQPVLLSRFQIRPADDGSVVLNVGPEKGNGVDLSLNTKMIHSLIALLDHALKTAAWDLGKGTPAPSTTEQLPPATIN